MLLRPKGKAWGSAEPVLEPVTLAGGARIAAPVHLTWLKRGLRNLVTNALRYAGTAHVSVLREDGMAVLRVEDEGPGIPPGRLEDVFNRFYSERPASEAFGEHSGLGLSIARQIIEGHDGSLVASNRASGGACFTLTLPLA